MDNLVLNLLSIENINKNLIKSVIKNYKIKDENDLYFALNSLSNKKILKSEIKKGIDKAQKILEISEKLNIKNIDILSKNYPKNLKNIPDTPLNLFYKGNVEILSSKNNIAIIGTRKPSQKGINFSYEISKYLSNNNFNIISGLAFGCDYYAHKASVDFNQKTVAVLAGGLNKIYPSNHFELSQKILENDGCLVSEYPVFCEHLKHHFIKRNRIQSGLSSAVILVESNIKSGSFHTVNYAIKQNKILAVCDMKTSLNQKLINENYLTIKNKNDLIKLCENVNNLEMKSINQIKFF